MSRPVAHLDPFTGTKESAVAPSRPTVDVMTCPPDAILAQAADRLLGAAARGIPCSPVRDLIGSADAAAAYAVQQRLSAVRLAAGSRVVGHKVGLTSPAVQQQLGVDQPDFGLLFDDMHYADSAVVPVSRLLQPKVEAEVAFVLGADLTGEATDRARVRDAVAYAVAALEIVDSRIAGWDISFGDTVADNASSGLFVLGRNNVELSDFEPVEARMTMRMDGAVVSTGHGASCLGDPLNALTWLARRCVENGEPLRAGQVILSGALGPMIAVRAGVSVVAEISGLGSVSATFSEE